MQRDVTLIKSDTPCREIMHLLAQDPGRPLLVANEDGFLMGVVTARDFLQVHLERTRGGSLLSPSPEADDEDLRATVKRIAGLYARDLMGEAPIVAQVDTAVSSVIVSMVQQSLNFVPVVREGRVAGVIGRTEILNHMLSLIAE
jgi:CBS domain-containing protein